MLVCDAVDTMLPAMSRLSQEQLQGYNACWQRSLLFQEIFKGKTHMLKIHAKVSRTAAQPFTFRPR